MFRFVSVGKLEYRGKLLVSERNGLLKTGIYVVFLSMRVMFENYSWRDKFRACCHVDGAQRDGIPYSAEVADTEISLSLCSFEMNCVKIQIKIKLKSRYIQNCFLQSQRSVSVICSQQQSISL